MELTRKELLHLRKRNLETRERIIALAEGLDKKESKRAFQVLELARLLEIDFEYYMNKSVDK